MPISTAYHVINNTQCLPSTIGIAATNRPLLSPKPFPHFKAHKPTEPCQWPRLPTWLERLTLKGEASANLVASLVDLLGGERSANAKSEA